MMIQNDILQKPVYAQDLLLVQLLHTANVCWLKSQNIKTFQLVTQSDIAKGAIDLHFGIPGTSPATHGGLLQSWLKVAADVERLYTIRLTIVELQKLNIDSSTFQSLKDEGAALSEKLFKSDMPGVFTSLNEAASEILNT